MVEEKCEELQVEEQVVEEKPKETKRPDQCHFEGCLNNANRYQLKGLAYCPTHYKKLTKMPVSDFGARCPICCENLLPGHKCGSEKR